MNIHRTHSPYVFRPPIHSPLLAPFIQWLNDGYYLRRRFKIRDIRIEGAERLVELAKAGHSLLIAPNHADHSDANALLWFAARQGLRFHFMASRECFEKSPLQAFVFQRQGVFSVDREGADVAAIKTAMQILIDGRRPLVVFPEGEIFHHQERLDPLNEGVATILLRIVDKIPATRRAYLTPTAVRFRYDPSVAETFSRRLDALEERIAWKPRPELDPVERIYRLGSGLLAIKEVEFLGEAQTGGIVERIANLQDRLVKLVEAKHSHIKAEAGVPRRIRALRGSIRKELADVEKKPAPERAASLHDDLDTLNVAFQLYSYPGQYLRENPSVNRIAETLLKLEEDVLDQSVYPVPRDVWMRFGDPIDVRAFLEEKSLTQKTGVGPLTSALGERIQAMLEQQE